MADPIASKIETDHISDFSKIMGSSEKRIKQAGQSTRLRDQPAKEGRDRINLDPDEVKNGLGQLVLTLIRLIHELLERQALRRIDAGSLTETQIESVGLALMKQADEIHRLRKEFNLEEEDLNLDLGPLGRLL